MRMSLLGFWKRHYRDIPRVRQILTVASRHGFGRVLEQLGLERFISFTRRLLPFKRGVHPVHRPTPPERLRMMLEELGPSFIKLGQVLASRPDLVPLEYARELCKLTDSVSPFPFEDVRKIIEHDLGGPLTSFFREIDPTPLAAASIAQIHRARLFDGRDVIVKVQRPNIDRIIERDISILEGIAELIESYAPDLAVYNPGGIVEEFGKTIRRELDFIIEAANAVRLRNNFKDSSILYVPEVIEELTSRRVIVLERIEGIRIDDIDRLDEAGFDRGEISRKGAAAYFQMVFQDGFFHADPHPGNIFVLRDGRIGLVDFGIMGRVSEENMEYFASIFIALAQRDFSGLVQTYIDMGWVPEETADIDILQRALVEEISDLLDPYYHMTAGQIDFGSYVEGVTRIMQRYRLSLPKNLYLVDKTLITLEGLLRQIDPDFDYMEAARPYVERLIKRKRRLFGSLRSAQKGMEDIVGTLSSMPRQVRIGLRKFLRGDVQVRLRHEEMNRFIRDIDKSSNRLAFSIITASIIVASSIVIHAGHGEKLFGMPVLGLIGYIIAALFGIWLIIGILRSGQL